MGLSRFPRAQAKQLWMSSHRRPPRGRKERKKEIPSKRACGGYRVHSGYSVLYEQGTKGWCPGICVDIIADGYVYVMAVLSEARIVGVMCVCVWLPPAEGSPNDAPGMRPNVLGVD